MLLRDALKKLKFDRRLQEYNIEKGVLSEDELNSHIGSLEDSQGACEPIRFREERRQEERAQQQQQQQQPMSHNGSQGGGFNNGSHY